MASISASALREVLAALREYERAVDASPLKYNSKKTRIQEAGYFVRWLMDDYEPGQGLRG